MKGIRCEGVSKTWPSGRGLSVEALKDVNLEVENGSFAVVLGPSGCGKSTLLELLAGLEMPTLGVIQVNEVQVAGPSPHRGLVFQEHSLFPWLSVKGNVAFGLRLRRIPKSERDNRVREILQKVGLLKFAAHFPHQLSGGMKQRVAIARGLVNEPDVLLMDEPFAALDFQTRYLMQRFLLEIWEHFHKTILFVTHHIDEAIMLADRIFVMAARPGRVIDTVAVDLPRPRDYTVPEFNRYRVHLTSVLEREVMKSYEEAS